MNALFIRLVYPWLSMLLVGMLFVLMVLRIKFHKKVVYSYSLGQAIKDNGTMSTHPYKKIFYALKMSLLFLLALAAGKPQLVDSRFQVSVEGVDIVLVLDVSGSMQFQDYEDDRRSRFEVAKAEAIRFIEKRDRDAFGLVLFGKDTVSRCPITFDRNLLQQTVDELKIGVLDPDGTMLITGMVTAANRLKYSKAKSKIMILLTDGEPSEGDMDPSVGIDVAKKLGIKVYTIGIGSEEDCFLTHPLYGLMQKPKVNKELLTTIAQQTGGRYFLAHSAHDMRDIYDVIDRLETSEHEVPVFSVYYDLLYWFIAIILGIIACELFLSTFVWFAL